MSVKLKNTILCKKLSAILLIGILGGSTILGSMVLNPKDQYLAFGQEQPPSVMDIKLSQAIDTLGDCGNKKPVCKQAIDEMMEALFVSNLVILPSADDAGVPEPETDQNFEDHLARMDEAINALNEHIQTGGSKAETTADAADARNFLQLTREALQVIGGQTAHCDPEDQVTGSGCQFLQADDEGGAEVDLPLSFTIGPFGFEREVRSPFFYGIPQADPQENIIVPGPLASGECVPIVKETQGVKVVVRPVLIPIWVEPWFARASIVGFQTIWVWEFVPAEYIKTISYCNAAGAITQDIDQKIVLDRGLMHMWKFIG